MRLELLSQDAAIVSARLSGAVTQDAYGPNDEPLSKTFGGDVYQRAVLLNLSDVPYIDSRGVGWLLGCHKQFRERGGVLVLHSLSPVVAQVLTVLRMNLVLDLADDETTARAKATATTGA